MKTREGRFSAEAAQERAQRAQIQFQSGRTRLQPQARLTENPHTPPDFTLLQKEVRWALAFEKQTLPLLFFFKRALSYSIYFFLSSTHIHRVPPPSRLPPPSESRLTNRLWQI